MNDRDFEAKVSAMLGRRAADIPDDLDSAEAGDVAPTVPEPRPWDRSARRRWTAAAAVVFLVAIGGGLAVAIGGESERVETSPAVDGRESSAAGSTQGMLRVAVRQEQRATYEYGSITLLEVRDLEGDRVGEILVAPAGEVMDPDAAPGSAGSDITSTFDIVEVAIGDYDIAVWQYECPAAGCPTEPLPSEVIEGERTDECATSVTVDTDGLAITAVFAPLEGCQSFGPRTEEHLQAASELLSRQKANGWVPYGGRLASGAAGTQTGWIRPEFEGCESAAAADGIGNLSRCPIFDAPDATIIGYLYSNLGFVPINGALEVDRWRTLIDNTDLGCHPVLPVDTCESGELSRRLQASVDVDDLTTREAEETQRFIDWIGRSVELAELSPPESPAECLPPINLEFTGPEGPLEGDQWQVLMPAGGTISFSIRATLRADVTVDKLVFAIATSGIVTPIRYYTPPTELTAGETTFNLTWDGTDDSGTPVEPGRYLLQIQADLGPGPCADDISWTNGAIQLDG